MTAQTIEKPQTPAEEAGLKVGDFVSSSWGYDQTNVTFYKVVGITPSGKSAKVQRWTHAVESGHGSPCEYVVPGSGPAWVTDWSSGEPVRKPAPVMTKKIKVSSWGGEKRASMTMSSYEWAVAWDGKAQYQTGSGWGR